MSSEETLGAAGFVPIVAGRGAVSVQSDHLLAEAKRLAEQLQSALESRAVTHQAIGITMSRSGGTEAEALERLRALSQTRHQRLAVIAREIVDGAAGWGGPAIADHGIPDAATESDEGLAWCRASALDVPGFGG